VGDLFGNLVEQNVGILRYLSEVTESTGQDAFLKDDDPRRSVPRCTVEWSSRLLVTRKACGRAARR
jgi:hypothetical protein